ncbi:MAG TPA: tyrosinase family protein [Nitrososphaeraceae archaeon]|nr:tyrosinase family protein [Nitrososphaeraceae archaeon]
MKGKTHEIKVRRKIPPSAQSMKFKNRSYRYNVLDYNTKPKPPQKADERKNQSAMSQNEKDKFIAAYNAVNSSGELGIMVLYHADMTHMMHSNMGSTGTQRFLPWHRVYLAELEDLLQAIDTDITIPYWDWTVDETIPTWLQSFTPTVPLSGTIPPGMPNPVVVSRTPGLNIADLPPQQDVDTAMAKTDFTPFTYGLETGSFDPTQPEFQTGMHDQVHVWVGGTMGRIPTAPADPMFWMHHANIDRIWSLWQKQNPGKNPTLAGPQATMDPWTATEEQTRDTLNFGYIYV